VNDRPLLMMARADFAASWYLYGMENLLVSYVTRPEIAQRLADLVSAYTIELFRHAVAAARRSSCSPTTTPTRRVP